MCVIYGQGKMRQAHEELRGSYEEASPGEEAALQPQAPKESGELPVTGTWAQGQSQGPPSEGQHPAQGAPALQQDDFSCNRNLRAPRQGCHQGWTDGQCSRGYLGDQTPHVLHGRAHSQSLQVRLWDSTVSLGTGSWRKSKVKGLQAFQNTVLQDPGHLSPHFQPSTLRSQQL